VPETPEGKILVDLNKLLEANDRLDVALDNTMRVWPTTPKCWIDQINEPTLLLEKHRLKNGQ
jgi:hypothetical protein